VVYLDLRGHGRALVLQSTKARFDLGRLVEEFDREIATSAADRPV
jgi:hypothetical protein